MFYARPNRVSFNALAGALELDDRFRDHPLAFPTTDTELLAAVRTALKTHARAVVCLSFASVQFWDMRRVVARLRRACGSRVVLVAGGPHPTGDPAGTLALGVDFVVRGEGEATLPALLARLATDDDCATVRGLAFLRDGALTLTPPAHPVDLDAYPSFAPRHVKYGPIEITRGCPFFCGYCQTAHLAGGRPRHRGVERVAWHVGLMRARNMPDVRVTSPNAFSYGSPDGKALNLPALEELLAAMKRTIGDGRIFFGSMPSEVRPEHVTEDTLRLLQRYASNDNLVIGAQSGSQRLLDLCRRGHTVADIRSAVTLARRHGLKANVDFIFGLPGETDDDADATAALMQELAALGARIHAHTFTPLPQTAFAHEPAGAIHPRVLAVARKLVARGAMYGQWKTQAREAQRIARHLRHREHAGAMRASG
jgi:B12-binding domain/radical SAM domain protein